MTDKTQYSSLMHRLSQPSIGEHEYWDNIPLTDYSDLKLYNLEEAYVFLGEFEAPLYRLVNSKQYLVTLQINKYVGKTYLYVRDLKTRQVGRSNVANWNIDKICKPLPTLHFQVDFWVPESAQKKIFKQTNEAIKAQDLKARYTEVPADLAIAQEEIKKLKDANKVLQYRLIEATEIIGENAEVSLAAFTEDELLSELAARADRKPKPKPIVEELPLPSAEILNFADYFNIDLKDVG